MGLWDSSILCLHAHLPRLPVLFQLTHFFVFSLFFLSLNFKILNKKILYSEDLIDTSLKMLPKYNVASNVIGHDLAVRVTQDNPTFQCSNCENGIATILVGDTHNRLLAYEKMYVNAVIGPPLTLL